MCNETLLSSHITSIIIPPPTGRCIIIIIHTSADDLLHHPLSSPIPSKDRAADRYNWTDTFCEGSDNNRRPPHCLIGYLFFVQRHCFGSSRADTVWTGQVRLKGCGRLVCGYSFYVLQAIATDTTVMDGWRDWIEIEEKSGELSEFVAGNRRFCVAITYHFW